MAFVPYEHFNVALFERSPVEYFVRPQCGVFLVKSTIDPCLKVKVWWTREGYEQLKRIYPDLPAFEETDWHGSFVNGRPLVNSAVPVFTCAGPERPRILFRVVHDGQPHDGMKARGYGLVDITPINFQILVDKHLRWSSRHLGPFLSATSCRKKARRMVDVYRRLGETGIRIIIFKTSGPGWDHKAQRLFFVPLLGKYLHSRDYQSTAHMETEYLVESHTPPESIMKINTIEDVKLEEVPKMRKRKKDDSTPKTKEAGKSTKRSKDFRRKN
ncbi:hypothetical protein NUW58_g7102 [Xylaria curta]|uniref:Uncharacterized protein n=1 Tax=Xylaria curta TaxID=42375 RepID=A0ACC1NLY3_9PEZI|nr:hypothetical protein NUW58_g7102 [Xylaria curta]